MSSFVSASLRNCCICHTKRQFVHYRSCHTQLSHTHTNYDNGTLLWQHTDMNLTVTFIENKLSVSYLNVRKTNANRHLYTTSAQYTLWVKKQDTKLLPITSPNINRFSDFLLMDSVVNLQQIRVKIFHHALNTSLHYLVKCECQKNGVSLKYVSLYGFPRLFTVTSEHIRLFTF